MCRMDFRLCLRSNVYNCNFIWFLALSTFWPLITKRRNIGKRLQSTNDNVTFCNFAVRCNSAASNQTVATRRPQTWLPGYTNSGQQLRQEEQHEHAMKFKTKRNNAREWRVQPKLITRKDIAAININATTDSFQSAMQATACDRAVFLFFLFIFQLRFCVLCFFFIIVT